LTHKCPLCLTPLKHGISLERYCLTHNTRKEFNCDARTLRTEMFCSEDRGDLCNETTNHGVFFRHIGCPCQNSFWNRERSTIEIPVQPDETSARYQTNFGVGQEVGIQVQHWQLGVLASLPRDISEMWFPAMLLRATAETSAVAKRVGVLVELAGAKESGKTILAMMSMNRQGYSLANGSSPEIEIRDYIYSSHINTGQFHRYVETLHLSTLLRGRQRRGLFLPQGTFRGRSVKVAFIKPSKNLQVPGDEGIGEDLRWPQRFALKALFAAPRLLQSFFSQTSLVAWQIMHAATNYPFWYTVVLYDTAGEANDAQDLQRELDAIDKVAIVINAGEIFAVAPGTNSTANDEVVDGDDTEASGSEADQSIKTACERIAKGVDRRQKLYLVVTQLDRIRNQIQADWPKIEVVVDSIGSKKYNRVAKEILDRWLQQSSSVHAEDLRQKLRRIKGVFFVWTEDLPQSKRPANQERLPRSRGLAKFICDCLDVQLSQITK